MDFALLKEILTRHRAGERLAVGLLAHVQGSAPQKPGARLIVGADGRMSGTVGGGCLEMETRRRVLIALEENAPSLFELRLDDDFGWDDGLICGGFTTLLVSPNPERMATAFEEALAARERGERRTLLTLLDGPDAGTTECRPGDDPLAPPTEKPALVERGGLRWLSESVRPDPTLYVIGGGHIGAGVVELAASVGFRVVAVDDRPEYASAERHPAAAETLCEDVLDVARNRPSGSDTFWVVVTRGHRNDGRVLAELIGREWAYVGMIGSRRKVRVVKEGMKAEGIATDAQLARVHSPIGLDIGGVTPREIALSIVAELVAVRRGKS